jgi:hypothetical protein
MMKTKTAVGLIAFLAIAPLGFFLYLIFFLPFEQNPGAFDRKHCEAIVTEVRSLGLKPGETANLRLDDISVPKSLRSLKPNEMSEAGFGEGKVWAAMTRDGKLKVVIETRDLGHAGEYGFAYSEVPLIASPLGGSNDGNWLELDLPGHLTITQASMKIDDHWWEVLNNLN